MELRNKEELRSEESTRTGCEGAFEGLPEPPPGRKRGVFVHGAHDTLPYAGKAVEFPDGRG